MNSFTRALVTLAETYAEARGISLWRVGHIAADGGKFFVHLRAGAGCHTATYVRVLQWFADNWPAGAAWPADIPRPAPARKDEAA